MSAPICYLRSKGKMKKRTKRQVQDRRCPSLLLPFYLQCCCRFPLLVELEFVSPKDCFLISLIGLLPKVLFEFYFLCYLKVFAALAFQFQLVSNSPVFPKRIPFSYFLNCLLPKDFLLLRFPDLTHGRKVSSNQNGCSRDWARDPAFSRSSVLSGVGTPQKQESSGFCLPFVTFNTNCL